MRDLLGYLLLSFMALCCFMGCSSKCPDGKCPTGQQCHRCCADCAGCPFDSQCHSTPDCPGGVCPLPSDSYETGSIEVGEPRNSDVNSDKLNEVKDQGCVSCPSQISYPSHVVRYPRPFVPIYRPTPVWHPTPKPAPKPAVITPAVHKPATAKPAKQNDGVREGVFHCVRCKKPTVGRQWHELWTDHGTPLTCLCEGCWQRTSASEKREHLHRYAHSVYISPATKFYVEETIREAVGM